MGVCLIKVAVGFEESQCVSKETVGIEESQCESKTMRLVQMYSQ
jgi:hypothetical protein